MFIRLIKLTCIPKLEITADYRYKCAARVPDQWLDYDSTPCQHAHINEGGAVE